MIGGRARPADSSVVTRRAWTILTVGLALAAVAVAAAAAVGGVFPGGGSSSRLPEPWRPTLYPWQSYFSPAQSRTVRSGLTRRGLDAASAHIVGAAPYVVSDHGPFLLVEATSRAGRPCFVPVLRVRLGPTDCGARTPVVVFAARDHFKLAPLPAQTNWSVVGLAGHGIVRVSIGDRVGACPSFTNTVVGSVLTFAGSTDPDMGILRAYDARGRVVLHVGIPGRSSGAAEKIVVLQPTLSRPQKARPGACVGMSVSP